MKTRQTAQSGSLHPTCSALVPPPSRVRRSVREITPGWPQAWWKLTCGHYITVPTWASGCTSPKPEPRLYICHKCEKARWSKWFDRHRDAWASVHGEDWSSKPNAEVSDRRAHAPENTTGANGGSLH